MGRKQPGSCHSQGPGRQLAGYHKDAGPPGGRRRRRRQLVSRTASWPYLRPSLVSAVMVMVLFGASWIVPNGPEAVAVTVCFPGLSSDAGILKSQPLLV